MDTDVDVMVQSYVQSEKRAEEHVSSRHTSTDDARDKLKFPRWAVDTSEEKERFIAAADVAVV